MGDRTTSVPEGDLRQAGILADPPPRLRAAVGRLAAVTTARLLLTAPPLGQEQPPGLGCAVLAAAIGARAGRDRARELAMLAPKPRGAYDIIAAFGVVSSAGRAGIACGLLTAALQARSPLTVLCDAPADGVSGFPSETMLADWLEHPEGHALIIRRLSGLPESDRQWRWRGDLLARFRISHLAFVLDVYETALDGDGDRYRSQVAACRAELATDTALAEVPPVAGWWRALAEIERSHPDAIRARDQLTGYSAGVQLYRRAARMAATG